ncbi:MAG: formate/nitrite transporter family protein [Oscillospiraceae bacterium]|jgi:formate/nitrite transporter FocA (FNT family)|nr:formate/nitrite transporter family protein [Oscillospiraceae bacterium]
MFKRSILAGLMIALAMVLYTKTLTLSNTFGSDLYKMAGAVIFAFALTYVKEQGLPLFTGKTGTDFSQKALWAVVLPFNLIGSALIAIPATFCGYKDFEILYNATVNDTPENMLFKAILCGALMRVACSSSSVYVTIGCVFAFLMSGFYHSIALSAVYFANLCTNADFNLGRYSMLIAIAVVGNFLGGCLITFLKDEKLVFKK